jgi:hypothetical protein
MDVVAKLPEDLQKLVVSFVPTEAQAKLDAFLNVFTGSTATYVKYNDYRDHYITVYRAAEPHEPYARQNSVGKWGRLVDHYFFGYRCEMRRVWADHIESSHGKGL